MRVIRSRRVIERQKYSGDDLNSEQEQQHAAEDISPARAAANRLVQRFARDLPDSRSFVQPVVKSLIEFLQFRFRHIVFKNQMPYAIFHMKYDYISDFFLSAQLKTSFAVSPCLKSWYLTLSLFASTRNSSVSSPR